MAVYLNLGTVSKKVTTSSTECQRWMDRGLVHSYGYNREEALRCYKKALTFDEGCVMAHYFIAYNNGSDYNNPGGFDYAAGYQESQKALAMALSLSGGDSSLPDWEMELIKAQVHRFCWPVGSKPMKELVREYANAMQPIYQKFSSDPDIAALYAESLMMLAPWQLWTVPPDVKAAIPETEEVVSVLEKALSTHPTHPGLCHLYIHVMELSATPEKALPAADALRVAVPDHGHLLHMPSHIDMWVGQYKESVDINKKAIISDQLYVKVTGHDNEFYKMYRMHNYHFLVWSAMFDGQFATALKYAEEAESQLGPEAITYKLGDVPIGFIYLEVFTALPWHVLVRFGKWEDIVHRPMKEDKGLYAGTMAIAFYARGVAFAAMGKIEEAEAELVKFTAALENKALEGRMMFVNPMHDPVNRRGVLDVAEVVLKGEIEYRKGNYPLAFEHLRLAVKRDTNLSYDEPWGWMMPARQSLGALLLEQGEAVEAEAMYREDLKQYKNNLWSLLGLSQALGLQGRKAEAEEAKAQFEKASVRADMKIGASCLCANKLSSTTA